MQLKFKQQLMILILLAAAMIIGVTLAVIVPSVRAILSLERNIHQIQVFLEQQYQKTRQLRRSTQAVDEVLSQIKQFEEGTMKKGDELRLITRLEGLAAEHQIEQTLAVNFEETTAEGPLPRYTFSFLNQGAFDNHLRFLRALERLPEYFVIRRLNWEKREFGTDSAAPITLRFDAAVYLAPPPVSS